MSSTEEIALLNMGFGLATGPTAEERAVQAGIDQAMRGVVADSRHNPNALEPVQNVTVASAIKVTPGQPLAQPRGRGWVDPLPLTTPPGIDTIDRMCDALLGPGVPVKK